MNIYTVVKFKAYNKGQSGLNPWTVAVSGYGFPWPVEELPDPLLTSGMSPVLLQSPNVPAPPANLPRRGPGVTQGGEPACRQL